MKITIDSYTDEILIELRTAFKKKLINNYQNKILIKPLLNLRKNYQSEQAENKLFNCHYFGWTKNKHCTVVIIFGIKSFFWYFQINNFE